MLLDGEPDACPLQQIGIGDYPPLTLLAPHAYGPVSSSWSGALPVWFRMCLERLAACTKVEPHCWHLYGRLGSASCLCNKQTKNYKDKRNNQSHCSDKNWQKKSKSKLSNTWTHLPLGCWQFSFVLRPFLLDICVCWTFTPLCLRCWTIFFFYIGTLKCVCLCVCRCVYVCIRMCALFCWCGRVYTSNDASWCMWVLSFAYVCMLNAFQDTLLAVKLSK